MNSNPEILSFTRAWRETVFVLLTFLALTTNVQAVPPTFWTGPNTNYTQNPVGSGQDVLMTGAVSLDRAQNNRLYNGLKESSHGSSSPTDTEWASATPAVVTNLTAATNLTYTSFDGWVGGHDGFPSVQSFIVQRAAVVHLISENTYISIKFSAWGAGFAGGFAYARSTAAAVVPPTPTVSITNPVSGATFAAPANVKIKAAASVSGGTVTNVAFFSAFTPLGSAQSAPFNITASGLTAGAYQLRAIATAGGVSATSAVVTVTVVNPVAVSNSLPVAANGQFNFTYTANPGLTYLVQSSPDLTNWFPVSTNVAASNPVLFSAPLNLNSNDYYRVGLLPNP